jgi:ASC-1-like (ASCH) protein
MEKNYKTYHNHRAEPYFTFVKNGQKNIELRLKKGWYQYVVPGDHIVIYNEEETDNIEVIVKDIRSYKTAREMFEKEDMAKIVPDATSIEHGLEIFKRFYTTEQETKYGIVAIEIERI